jgi:type VI secretion system secreted protein VgrG
MAEDEIDLTEAAACPLLGLPFDRRTHYAVPDPGHRCFAGKQPATADFSHQATYCLTARFGECERFRVSEHPDAVRVRVAAPTADGPMVAQRDSAWHAEPVQVTADFSARRRTWRDAAAVVLVGVLVVFIYSLVATHGTGPAKGVLIAVSPTPSPQATAAPSVMPTNTPTPSESPSPSASPSPTPTPSPNPTPSPSPSPSPPPSPRPSPTRTPSPTVRPTPTPQPTPKPTPTQRPTPKPTPKPTPIQITPPPQSPTPTSAPAP